MAASGRFRRAVPAILLALLGPVSAGTGAADPLERRYVWYDGAQERVVWLNPALVVEFETDGPPVGAAPRVPGRSAPAGRGGPPRFWRLAPGDEPVARSLALNARSVGSRFSPVLHDAPSASGRRLSLPGNAFVYLDPAWDAAAVSAWAASRGLTVLERLDLARPNVILVETPPGLAALDLANVLYRSGEVVAAFPNWWMELR